MHSWNRALDRSNPNDRPHEEGSQSGARVASASRQQVAPIGRLQPISGPLGCLGASLESCEQSLIVGVRSDPKPCNVITLEETNRTVSEGDSN